MRQSHSKAALAVIISTLLLALGVSPAQAAPKDSSESCPALKTLTVTKPATPALAKLAKTTTGRRYLRLRRQVVCTFNKRKPGAHIVYLGVGKHNRRPSLERVQRSIARFQSWLAPRSVVTVATGTTPQAYRAPVSVPSSGGGGCGDLPAYIVQRESGGDPNARNGRYGGCAQVDDAHFAAGGTCAGLAYIACVNKLWDGGRGAHNWPTAANPPR